MVRVVYPSLAHVVEANLTLVNQIFILKEDNGYDLFENNIIFNPKRGKRKGFTHQDNIPKEYKGSK